MIRFNCPTCSRGYVLADALAHLPLLCKGCGQRLAVPDPTPEPDPTPVQPKPAPPLPTPRPPAAAPPLKVQSRAAGAGPDGVGSRAKPEPTANGPVPAAPGNLDGDFLSSGTLAQLESPLQAAAPTARPPKPSALVAPAADPARGRKLAAGLVDALVALALLGAGVIVGEVVAKKSTGEILRGAGSAPKFPPTDLLIWLGCVAFFGLVYAWLGTRGWTVGGWLKRRAG